MATTEPLPSPLWPPPSHYQASFRHYQATTKPPLAITKPWTVITQTCRALTFSVIAHGTQNRQYCCLPSAGNALMKHIAPPSPGPRLSRQHPEITTHGRITLAPTASQKGQRPPHIKDKALPARRSHDFLKRTTGRIGPRPWADHLTAHVDTTQCEFSTANPLECVI